MHTSKKGESMQKVNLPSGDSALPFAMQFASIPQAAHLMSANASTITSEYTTDCTGVLDDAPVTSKDD